MDITKAYHKKFKFTSTAQEVRSILVCRLVSVFFKEVSNHRMLQCCRRELLEDSRSDSACHLCWRSIIITDSTFLKEPHAH